MAKKKKEEVVEEITKDTEVNEPKGKETKGDVTKVQEKMKMKPVVEEESMTKIDLSKPVEEKIKEEVEETTEETSKETPILEEITEETKEVEETAVAVEEAIVESMETGEKLPDNVQKLVQFMEDTGGDLNDYVKLNKDYSELDDKSLLKEYYKSTKPHLDNEEIDFIMEDTFLYDEEVDEEKDIKRKKLALKEQVASAKSHLDGLKSKYYEDIKSGSKLNEEQKEAIDFYHKYKKESKARERNANLEKSVFLNKTKNVFNDEFKGFEYSVGEKKYRFNVKDVGGVKENQSDINNFVKKFLNKKNQMEDARGYHKSLFTAMNADTIANHFYEQGKADALKESVAKSKNIDMDPRQSHSKEFDSGGLKFRVLGDSADDFKFKIKNK